MDVHLSRLPNLSYMFLALRTNEQFFHFASRLAQGLSTRHFRACTSAWRCEANGGRTALAFRRLLKSKTTILPWQFLA